MKKVVFSLVFLFLTSLMFGQEKTLWEFDENQADTNFWGWEFSANSDSLARYLNLSGSDEAISGTQSMKIDYKIQNSESWGGYGKIEHWNPDSNATYDFSAYDTISFWYKNVMPQDDPGQVHIRFELYDVSNSPDGNKTYKTDDLEFYYSFEYILDDSSNEWKEWKIALDWNPDNPSWDGKAFNRTGWAGNEGNNKLDADKIKGFAIEFSIGGGGEMNTAEGSILFDKITLSGAAEKPLVFFNGAAIPSTKELFVWNGSAEVEKGAGNNEKSPNAIKWVHNNAWTGVGFNINPAENLSLRWPLDTLKFKMKAEEGVGNLRLQFEDGTAKIGANFDPVADNAWHQYEFALKDLTTYYDGTADFNFENVAVMQILTEGTGTDKTVYIDDWWTGSPVFDLIPPVAPENLTAIPGDFVNFVTWDKVAGEENETYSVYYSLNPISDPTAEGVEVLVQNYSGELLSVNHVLRAPVKDTDLSYYYAVECYDAAGNVSPLSAMASPLSNKAEGVPTIHFGAPNNFAPDGDLADWGDVTPIVVSQATNTGFIPANQKIDGDDDLSAEVYLAVDDNYLYVAFNVTDDQVSTDVSGDTWMNDAPDLFIGLYDWHGASHAGYQKEAQPDYHFRFNKAQAILDNDGGKVFANADMGNYYWEEGFLGGYVVEVKISLDSLAYGGRARFNAINGQRIPLDIAINDADGAPREGILTYSPNNEDKSHQTPSRWTYTWIGDRMTDVKTVNPIADEYSLEQNYPNPFNPTTNIKFSLKNESNVTLKIFDAIGREVTTLVNEQLKAGVHQVNFNAANLASGMYFYRITAGSFTSVKKMMLLK